MKLIYVGHPFGGDRSNLDLAERWVAMLAKRHNAIFWAPWVPLCRHWENSGDSLSRGLAFDEAAVRRSDGALFIGTHMSPGMQREILSAKRHWNMTGISMDNWGDGENVALGAWIHSL